MGLLFVVEAAMIEISDAIRWWENELTAEQRDTFLGEESWSGEIPERHERLLGFYQRRQR
jgi:hypothetical protein